MWNIQHKEVVGKLMKRDQSMFSYSTGLVQHKSCITRKTVFVIFYQVQHPGCTAAKYGYRLENSDQGSGGIVQSMKRNQRR